MATKKRRVLKKTKTAKKKTLKKNKKISKKKRPSRKKPLKRKEIKTAKKKVPKKVKKNISKKINKFNLKNQSKSRPPIINTIKKILPAKIKVPKKLKQKAGTGIAGYDKMTNSGFERDSINLIAGGTGSGKSIFAAQFLIEGVKKGEKVLYITFEEKKQEFYNNMKKIGLDLEKFEKTGKFIFLEYSPEKVKMMLDEGGGTIESTVLKHQITRLVIDSITSFSLLFDDELSRRQSNLGLFDIIRKWDVTTVLTVQYDPLDSEDKGISSIEFEADSITLLYFVNLKNKRQRYIEVLKMRGTNHSKEIRTFEIKKGIKIGKKARKRAIIS